MEYLGYLKDIPEFVQISIYVIIGLISLLGLWKIEELIKSSLSKNKEDDIYNGIKEWLTIAILTAYRTSDQSLDDFGHMLTNSDRLMVAGHVYEYLPETIQKAIPYDSWLIYIENHYDKMLDFWWQWRNEFGKLAEERLREEGKLK